MLAEKPTSTQLHGLDSISPVRSWDYSLPTLTRSGRFTERQPWNEDDLFADALFKRFPLLKEVSLVNLALVGGAVTSILMGQEPADLDFFVIADDESKDEAALAAFGRERAERFIAELYEFMKKKNADMQALEIEKQLTDPEFHLPRDTLFEMDSFRVQRRHNVFTIYLTVPSNGQFSGASRSSRRSRFSCEERHSSSMKIQITCMAFKSLVQRLQLTDIDATAVGFYDGHVSFSTLAKFSFESLAIVVDVTKMIPIYVDRLIKYFERGFDLILPHLDLSKVRQTNFKFGLNEVIDLPFVNIFISSIIGRKVVTTRLEAAEPKKDEAKEAAASGGDEADVEEDESSDGYGDSAMDDYSRASRHTSVPRHLRAKYGMPDEWSVGVKIHHNIKRLIHNQLDAFLYYGEGTLYRNAFAAVPQLTERMIVNSYETVRNGIIASGAKSIDFTKMSYFTCRSPAQIAQSLLTDYFQRAAALKSGKHADVFFGDAMSTHIGRELDVLVGEQVAHTKQLVRELEQRLAAYQPPAKRTQLCTLPVWYGTYYRAL